MADLVVADALDVFSEQLPNSDKWIRRVREQIFI